VLTSRLRPLLSLRLLLRLPTRWLAALVVVFSLLGAPAQARTPSMRAATDDPAVWTQHALPPLPADFQTVQGVYLRVHHAPEDRGVALLLARHGAHSLPDFADRLSVPTGGTIDVVLAHTQQQFDTLQPGSPPDWADGTAWPTRGLVFLRSPDIRPGTDEALTTVLDHEIVHILLGRSFRGQPVPHWLQEGVAQVYARQYTKATTDTLASGLLGRELMSMEDLATGFPSDPVRARLAYAQSADLVAWLQNEHGPDAVPTIARELSQGAGFGAAVRAATGQSVDDIDSAWRARLTSSGLWLKPLVSDTVMFTIGAVVLVVGGLGVIRRKRQTLARWEAEERARDAVEAAMAVGVEPSHLAPQWTWQHPVDDRDGYSDSATPAAPTVH